MDCRSAYSIDVEKQLKAQLAEAQAEIERLKKAYGDIVEEYRAYVIEEDDEFDFYQSRTRSWKRCAKRWKGYAINHIGLGCVLVRSINNKWWNVEKPSPAWREEAQAYLRGEIELTDQPPKGEESK